MSLCGHRGVRGLLTRLVYIHTYFIHCSCYTLYMLGQSIPGLSSSSSPCRYTWGVCVLRSNKSTDMCVGLGVRFGPVQVINADTCR